MANDTSAQRLIERILEDARAEAEAARQSAEETAAKLRAASLKKCDARRMEGEEERAKAARQIVARCRRSAELEGRKRTLAQKREVLDALFSRAYESLCALPLEERAKICRAMLLREAEGGEKLQIAEAERTQLLLMLPGIEAKLLAAGKKPLVPSAGAADLEHGFVLIAEDYEKDCSFRALIAQLRAEEETRVAKMLFPEKAL